MDFVQFIGGLLNCLASNDNQNEIMEAACRRRFTPLNALQVLSIVGTVGA